MTDFLTLPGGLVERLGWVLIHSVWQFPLCALLLFLAERTLAARTSATKYLVSLLAITSMVAAAGTTYVLAWADGTSVSEDAAAVRDKVESESSPPVVSVFTEDPSLRPNGVAGVVTGSTGSDSLAEPRPNGSTEETTRDWSAFPSATQAQVTSALRPWLSACVLAWVVGMALGATRILAGGLQVHRLRRNGLSIVSDEIAQILDETAARLRVRIPVRIKESSLVAGPVVIGWLRPLVLLPGSAVTGLSGEQLTAVLAHELAHIRRRDYLFNMLQTIVETIFFYHPAVWWVSHRIRVHREDCCDDLAVAAVSEPATYASALLALHEKPASNPAPVLAATGGKLTQRIHRILGLKTSPQFSWWRAGMTTSVVVFVAACSLLGCVVFASGDDNGSSSPDAAVVADEGGEDHSKETDNGTDAGSKPVPLPPAETAAEREILLKQLESLGISRSSALDIQPSADAGASPYTAKLWNVPDAAWPILGRLPTIRRVDLSASSVSPEAFRHVRGIKSLQYLTVMNSRFEPQHLQSLAELKQLREIDVMLTVFDLKSEERIKQLGELSPEEHMTFVEIAGPQNRLQHIAQVTVLTDRALKRLGGLVNLERLKLVNTYVSPQGLLALQNMRKLREVEFACRPTLTRDTTRIFDGMEDLQKISLTGSVDPAAAAGLKNAASLSELSVFGVTDEVAIALADVPSLERLSLWSNALSDDGLQQLARLVKLERLDVRHAHRGTFTLAGIQRFQKSRQGCEVLHSLKVDALAERHINIPRDWYMTGFYWRRATTQQALIRHVKDRFSKSEHWIEFQPFTRKGYIGGVALLNGKTGQAWLQKEIGQDENYEVKFSEQVTAKRLRDEGILFAALQKAVANPNNSTEQAATGSRAATSHNSVRIFPGESLPPFPVLIERLRELGRNDAADFLKKRHEFATRKLSRNSRAVIAYGRVAAPAGESPRLCNAQMAIHPGGWFFTAIGDKDLPIGFRMSGCRPIDIVPAQSAPGLKPGGMVSLGRIVMEPFPVSQLATVRGRLKFGREAPHQGVRIRVIIRAARTNSASGGTDGSIEWPEKENATLAKDLQFEHRTLAPLPHRLHIEAPSHRHVFRNLELTAGGTLDLGTIEVPAAPEFQVEFLASATTDFTDSKLREATVLLDERWRSNPDNPALAKYPSGDMGFAIRRINRSDPKSPEAVFLRSGVASLKIADLGQSDLTSLRRKLDKPTAMRGYRDLPIRSGHVYLTYHTHWKHWTILRVKFEAP